MRRIISTAAVALTAVFTLGACGGGGDPLSTSASSAPSTAASSGGSKVVVGSANFPENVLLASIYSQALQAKGVQVEEKFNIGSREVIYDQVKSGALTVLPEYNGGLLSFLDPKSTAASTDDVNTELKSKLATELEILDSSRPRTTTR